MTSFRTQSICEYKDEFNNVCTHAIKTVAKDDLTSDSKSYVVYYCGFKKPVLRCPCYISDKVIDWS